MGWHTGMLLFDGITDPAPIAAALLPNACPTDDAPTVEEAMSASDAVVGLGRWSDKTILVDRYWALELTASALGDPDTDTQVGGLAPRVLAIYLHEVSGSYGITLFENGQRTLAFYTQENTVYHDSQGADLSPPFAALALPTNGDRFFQYLDLFMEKPFAEWAYEARCTIYQ